MIYNKLGFLLLVTLLSVGICRDQDVLSYNIELKLENEWKQVGQLVLDQQIQYKKAEVSLQNHREYIINWENLQQQQKDFGLLKFTNENDNKNYFLSHIDFKQQSKFQNLNKTKRRNPVVPQEVLEIITNIDDQVVAINYAVKTVFQSEFDNTVKATFVESQEATEAYFIADSKSKGGVSGGSTQGGNFNAQGQQEPEAQQAPTGILGFLKNNFWYILIFLFVVMMLSNGEEAAQQAQGGAQQAQSGGRRKRN